MEKIAIIVQRYSTDVNGGAEFHARLLAEHLKEKYEVEVITTCAQDYISWDNHYPEGKEYINDIKVIRFKSEQRNRKEQRRLSRYLRGNLKYIYQRYRLRNILVLPFRKFWYKTRRNYKKIFERWVEAQGPLCPDMISFLKKEKDNYKVCIFFTYLYYPTYKGIQVVSDKSILIPTAHDESTFYFDGFRELFKNARFLMYNTSSEKKLVESVYPEAKEVASDIAGVGFDGIFPQKTFQQRPMSQRYFVYIGRIDINKGCVELLTYFQKFKKTVTEDIQLVMIGKNHLETSITDDGILHTGFIDEDEKLTYLQNCEALIIPSYFESLSMVTLEAMAMGKPVIANGACEVLQSHIENSGAGYTYTNQKEFNEALQNILKLTENKKEIIAEKGMVYVDKNYRWDTIIKKFEKAIESISGD